MATKTDNLKLSKAETSDGIKSTLTANNQNFDILDGVITRLKNNQLQGTASGTEIEISDAGEVESVLQLSGNSEQDSRSGKNKIDISATHLSSNGATSTVVNNNLKVTATLSGSSYLYDIFPIPNSDSLLGKTMTLYADIIPSASNTGQIAIYESTPESYTSKRLLLLEQSGSAQITFPTAYTEEGSYFTMFLYANATNGTAISGDFVTYSKLQLEEGSTATSYEPYGLQPSPDYPSEIRSVTGDVEVKVEGKNKFDMSATLLKTSGTSAINGEDSIKVIASGTGAYAWAMYPIPNSEQLLGKTITFSAQMQASAQNVGCVLLTLVSSSGTVLSDVAKILGGSGSVTITMPSEFGVFNGVEATNFVFLLYANRAGTLVAGDYVTYTNVQLEEGTTATPYEPYKAKTISLPLGDLELRSTPDGTRDTFTRVNGVWNVVSGILPDIINGTQTPSWVSGVSEYGYLVANFSNNDLHLGTGTKTYVLSNKFKSMNNSDTFARTQYGVSLNSNSRALQFSIKVSELTETTATGVKEFFSNNPTDIIAKRSTPTYTPITDQALITALDELEQLILHQGYNHITATAVNGVKAYLDLSYYKDINIVLDNINASILSLGGDINV